MARKGELTAEEVLAAEKAVDDRKQSRNRGFSMMKVRDRGAADLKDYAGHSQVRIEWAYNRHVDAMGLFKLVIDRGGNRNEIILDAEEFRKWLRWV